MKRNIQLGTTTSITTSYSGDFANQYIAAALLSASTINDGGITVKPNINYKEVLKKVDTGSLVSYKYVRLTFYQIGKLSKWGSQDLKTFLLHLVTLS